MRSQWGSYSLSRLIHDYNQLISHEPGLARPSRHGTSVMSCHQKSSRNWSCWNIAGMLVIRSSTPLKMHLNRSPKQTALIPCEKLRTGILSASKKWPRSPHFVEKEILPKFDPESAQPAGIFCQTKRVRPPNSAAQAAAAVSDPSFWWKHHISRDTQHLPSGYVKIAIENGDLNHSYVKLPEGTNMVCHYACTKHTLEQYR